jgi:hypothetical protein
MPPKARTTKAAAAAPPAETPPLRLERRNYGRGHGYKLDGEKILGVTTAIDVLDKPALREWYAKQAAARAVDEWDRLADLPVSERLAYIQRGARDTTTAAALRGTDIHRHGQALAEGREVDVPDEYRGPVEAYARWLDEWDVTPWAVETPLASTQHLYAGTADLWGHVGRRDGAFCLLDIKTGRGVYDETGLQLAAYRFADLIQVETGVEVSTPPVDLVYVAHILPDTVRMLPVVADEGVFRAFLYVLTVARARKSWEEWPLIGAAELPDGGDVS